MSNNAALSRAARAGRTNKNDLWGSAGSTVSESNSQHFGQVVGDILLLFIVTVIVVNELTEDVVHFFVVDFELTVELLSRVLELIAVKSCSNFRAVVSDTSDRDLLGDI